MNIDLATRRGRSNVQMVVFVAIALGMFVFVVGVLAALPLVGLLAIWFGLDRWVARGEVAPSPFSTTRQVKAGDVVTINGQTFVLRDPMDVAA